MPHTQPPLPRRTKSSDERLDEALDEALDETFPASDPIAVDAAEPPNEDKRAKIGRPRDPANSKKPKGKRPTPA